jgi:hypothetical protein
MILAVPSILVVDDLVACFRDGWGKSFEIEMESANVVIHAWVLQQSDNSFTKSSLDSLKVKAFQEIFRSVTF